MATLSLGRESARPSCTLPRFTSGPWHVGSHRSIGSPVGTICETYSHMGIEEADANERLIAASPDLYHALTAALVIVAGCNADGAFDKEERAIRGALRLALEGRCHG